MQSTCHAVCWIKLALFVTVISAANESEVNQCFALYFFVCFVFSVSRFSCLFGFFFFFFVGVRIMRRQMFSQLSINSGFHSRGEMIP